MTVNKNNEVSGAFKFDFEGRSMIVNLTKHKILTALAGAPLSIAEVAALLSLKPSTVEQAMIEMRTSLRAAGIELERNSVYNLRAVPVSLGNESSQKRNTGRRGKK